MVAIAIALIISLLVLSWANTFWAVLVTAWSALAMAWLARRQIGGQTGDVLGAAEQVAETAVLLLLSARFA
jgi:adenosylcobinamide-GDP ribazoletransferase